MEHLDWLGVSLDILAENNVTYETNYVRDNGMNYFMGLHIAPTADAGFGQPVAPPYLHP